MPPKTVKQTQDRVSGILVLLTLILAFSLCSCGPRNQAPSAQTLRARWHNNQGVVYMDQHNYTRGFEQFSAAVALEADYATGHANLGIAYYSLGKYDSASVALQRALELDPGHLHALYTSGLIYHAQGREDGYPKALEAFRRVASADADDPLVRYYLGRTLAKLGQHEEAITEFRRAIDLDPFNVSAYYNLSNQLRTLKRMDEWKTTLEKFKELSSVGHEGVSASYQGQGPYGEALIDGRVDGSSRDRSRSLAFAETSIKLDDGPDRMGLTAAVDADGDGLVDLLINGEDGSLQLFHNEGGLSFSPSTMWTLPAIGVAETETGALRDLIVGDCDDDGDLDLVGSGQTQTALLRQQEQGFAASEQIAGPSIRSVFGDIDHDGDLDLLVMSESGKALLINDGVGSFTDRSSSSGLIEGPGSEAIFADFDNDRDVDFLVLGTADGAAERTCELYTNNRDGSFSEVAAHQGLVAAGATDLAVGDFDADAYMDVVTIGGNDSPTLFTNQRGRSFARREIATAVPGFEGIRAADIDNDGDLDLVIFGNAGMRILAHVDDEFVADMSLTEGEPVAQLLVRDFDADGRIDVWASNRDAQGARIYRNQTVGGQWIQLSLRGLNSNPNGFGTKVEVKTAHGRQKRELRGGSRDAETLTFGLAEADSVEFVRILWPSGVRQTELATSGGQRLNLTELNRKGTSCPILYAWDGTQFRFVSDFLGGGIIGYLVAPGEFFIPDTDEYLPLGPIAPRNGNYAFQMTNQLEEIIYLDAAALVAVDHPAGVSVFANERLMSQPPYPEFGVHTIDSLHSPRRAVDGHGRDITRQLLEVDDDWYDGFALTPIHGYAQPYSLELEMGDLSALTTPVLIAHGWVDYAHSSSNWAASQQGLQLSPPRLEVGDGNDGWRLVTTDMGTPAGLPKYMTFDLRDQFVPGDYRLRISTNTAIYWDQIVVGSGRQRMEDIAIHHRTFETADLHWRGYPEHTPIKGTFAFRYHYDKLNPYSDWGTHDGAFTRFGDVAPLLDEVDDRFVIMFHGDELTVEVPATAFPPLPPGTERTFLLHADGFGKDMDYHSAHSLTVGPLPFHGMSAYPYPESEAYPEGEHHVAYQQEYNTRWIKGHYE